MGSYYELKVILLILILASIITVITLRKAKTWQEKAQTLLLLFGTTIYSGLGIANNDVDNSYIVPFLFFLVAMAFGIIAGYRVFEPKTDFEDRLERRQTSLDRFINNKTLINAFAIIFWIIVLARLVYPVNCLPNLFSFSVDIHGVFENHIAQRSNMITYILSFLSLIMFPGYCVFLFSQKPWMIVVLLALQQYLDAVTDGYIGRTAIIVLIVQCIFVLTSKSTIRKGEKRHNMVNRSKCAVHNESSSQKEINKHWKKTIFICCVTFVALMPFFFDYISIRTGAGTSSGSFIEKCLSLIESEIYYPMHYARTESLVHEVITPLQYLYWFITLPIPKQLISFLPTAIALNFKYSSIISGRAYASSGYSVSLVSLLGEGFLLWGRTFAFFHGLFIGFVWGGVCAYCHRYRKLEIYQIWIIAKTLNLVRGGSQGSISSVINTLIPFLLMVLILGSFIKTGRAKRNSSTRHRFTT